MQSAKIQVTNTYGKVCIFQLQDINQLLDETRIQDCVQMFLSRVRVNYDDTSFSHPSKTLNENVTFFNLFAV